MKATVLAYGYDSKQLKTLKTVCTRLDIRLRRVDAVEYAQPIGALFGLSPRVEDSPDAGDVSGRMLVLAGFGARQTDAFLSALKTARAGDSLKAVLTDHNGKWTGPALYAELTREHRTMQAQ